jgi:site-specific DNA-methyltransferase (adenine-specific)
MEPYNKKNSKLLEGDFLNHYESIQDNSIDLLLTDPPYNISEKGANPEWNKIDPNTGEKINLNTIHNQKFDSNFEDKWDSMSEELFLINLQKWSKFWFSKLRKGGSFAIFISDRYISHLWSIMENDGFEPKRIWTWKKPAAVPFNRKVNPVSGSEYILWGIKPNGKRIFNSDVEKSHIVFRYSIADKISSILYKKIKDDPTINLEKCFQDALIEAKKIYNSLKRTGNIEHCIIPNTITYSGGLGSKIHPTQKPEEILEFFISLLTNENDTVLDTFAGSGSTGIVCERLKRNFILIEKDNKMFNLMKNRFVEDKNENT